MNIEAFKQLIRVLDQVIVDNKPFDMNNWGVDVDDLFIDNIPENKILDHLADQGQVLTECGTIFCAAGYAAQDDWFTDRDFVLADKLWSISIYYDGEYDFDAIQRFFEIDEEMSRYIFDPDQYDDGGKWVTSTMVKERIQALISQ